MIRAAVFAAALLVLPDLAGASPPGGVVHLDLDLASKVSAASLDYIPAAGGRPRGILVLVPGANGSGAEMLAERPWADFARTNGFILAAFTFVSKAEDLRGEEGYYDTPAGSGAIASAALKKLGAGKVPAFMYGFSGGAHFTASFADSFPHMLKGWCAASFENRSRGEKIARNDAKGRRPPGIVACGSEDQRLGASLAYYSRGRALGRKWTWVEIADVFHERSPELEEFARRYFMRLLGRKGPGVWIDIGSGEDVAHSVGSAKSLQAWLPDADLVADWRALSAPKPDGVIERVAKTRLRGYEQLTLFLRMPRKSPPAGVMCLSLLANSPLEVRERIRSCDNGDALLGFAAVRDLAVVAWGARRLWDPSRNWDELPKAEAKRVDADFDLVAAAWDSAIDYFVKRHGLPSSGYLMYGVSGAAQYAMRLALRRPKRFLAVHAHIASSFDLPVKEGASILWCVTTGENEMGYARSRRFFSAARGLRYPIVYKAYPGLGHAGNAATTALGLACFDYALEERARAARRNAEKSAPAAPDWAGIFSSAEFVADIFNQAVYPKSDYLAVPSDFRMHLPSALREAWASE